MLPACASATAPAGVAPVAGHRWEALRGSSAPNARVHWPDGHTTVGLDERNAEIDRLLDFAPDVRVEAEPTRTSSGEWTTVVRVLSGTFSRPLTTREGKTVAPAHQPFRIWVASVSHSSNGVVDDLYLFWSDRALKNQLGI